MSPNSQFSIFQRFIIPSRRSIEQNPYVDDVRPTYGMCSRNNDRTLEFVATLRVPLVLTSPPQAPQTSINHPQPPQREVSKAEFQQSIQMIAQIMASQSWRSKYVNLVPVSSESTRVDQFKKMNPPTLTGTKVREEP